MHRLWWCRDNGRTLTQLNIDRITAEAGGRHPLGTHLRSWQHARPGQSARR